MAEQGISRSEPSAVMMIYRLTRDGKLTVPKMPGSRFGKLTQTQIDEIITELSPGGSGQWHWKGGDLNER